MKLTERLSIYNIIIYWTILLLGFLCIGCSSKSDEDRQDEAAPPTVASEEQRPISSNKEIRQTKQANEKLEKTPTKTISRKKQIVKHDNKQKNKVTTIIAELASSISTERKIELIESLSELSIEQDPSVIIVVRKALDDPNPEVRHAAIELLEDYETPEILPVVAQALKSGDEQTREYALLPLSNVNDPRVSELLVQALEDTSEDVRATALEVAEDHEEQSIKLSVMEKGIICPYPDVKEATISMLEDRADHRAVEILIVGLKDSDSYFHELVNEALDFLIDKEFETYEQAQSWWLANKDNYDEELFRIEEE